MSSMRDAMRRLQVVYENCVPEAVEAREALEKLDEFTRLRKRLSGEVKVAREAIKERDSLIGRGGTTSESAEASYRIRLSIKTVKETLARMTEIHEKEKKKAKGKHDETIDQHKEVLELCQLHVEEIERLEKAKGQEQTNLDRAALMGDVQGMNKKESYIEGLQYDPNAPDMATNENALPDIYVEEDLKKLDAKNKELDDDLDIIGQGVAKLKDIALDINQELDKQDEQLNAIDKKADKALDHVDTINIQMKKSLEAFMPADNFMVNCILICIILAFVGYISSLFT